MSKKSIIAFIKKDYYRYYGTEKLKIAKLFFGNPGFRYTVLLRLDSKINRINWVAKIILFIPVYIARHLFLIISHIFIPNNIEIGPGFRLFHPINIRISAQKIGINCTIGHSVTLGHVNHGKKKGVPEIGDNVFIGPGSIIIGKVKIGNNVVIAPNSFVMEDVPSNRFVSGNPARIYPNLNGTKGYISNPIEID